jgi:predicted nucleic acid-binding protein
VIVLDTNVVSELMRASPAPVVLAWLRRQVGTELFTTAVTVAEVRYGIARMPDGRRKDDLRRTADEVFGAFPEQVLPFDSTAAEMYADVVANRERAGNPIDGFDAQIASVCRVHRARLATRNVKDFRDTGVEAIDPWQDDGKS